MATVATTKPSVPHQQKMKRPPLPAVQTNGIQPNSSSHSPSTSSKRPPSSFKHPNASAVNSANGDVNGTRLSNRRRESQKLGEIRPSRRVGPDGERRIPKRMTEPYVKTQSHILKRYKNKPPSLTIHLHQTHFRFDQQDGSFSYNSPMKFVLEHLKAQTIPHDMMEELQGAGVKFYEGCLIVQVQDHRSSSGKAKSTSAESTKNDAPTNAPFSIHNYSEHLTPSPYVPYRNKSGSNTAGEPADNKSPTTGIPRTKEKQAEQASKIFTVVLFPTSLSLQEEVFILANTVDPRSSNRKQSINVPRTPASATVPQTPLSAVPPTPAGPPNKKLKMCISGNEIHDFESKAIATTAPPLFLDIVNNIGESQTLLENLTDDRHKEALPKPKTRKRTEAELAADEFVAQQEQAFMLIMDERHSASGPSGAKAAASDGDGSTTTFQPSYESWQAIKNIKAAHQEKAAREAEAKALRDHLAQQNKLKLEQQEKAARHEAELRAQQHLLRQAQAQRQAMVAGQNMGHGHPLPNGVSRAQNSSPVVRNGTPNVDSSPLTGGLPMNVTSAGQGVTSSPARPPSAMRNGQHGGVGMTHQRSQQRDPSRTGTPHSNGTPSIPHATPVVGQTGTPRVSQGSPPMVPTPVVNHSIMANQHLNGHPQQLTAQQYTEITEQKRRQQQIAQQQHNMLQQQQQRLQNNSPNPHMSPDRNLTQMPTLQQQVAFNSQQQALLQRREYERNMAMHHQTMGNHNMPNGASPSQHPQQPGHPTQRPPPARIPGLTEQEQARVHSMQNQFFMQAMQALAQRYGGQQNIPPGEKLAAQQAAQARTHQAIKQIQQKRATEIQQQRMQMAGIHGMNGMNGQGMPNMNGMNTQAMQNMSDQQRQHFMQQFAQMPHVGGAGLQQNPHMNGNGMGM